MDYVKNSNKNFSLEEKRKYWGNEINRLFEIKKKDSELYEREYRNRDMYATGFYYTSKNGKFPIACINRFGDSMVEGCIAGWRAFKFDKKQKK